MLETDGMQYVITNSQIILQVVSGLLKATVLLLTENLILMQLSYCVTVAAQLLYVTFTPKGTINGSISRRSPTMLPFHRKIPCLCIRCREWFSTTPT